MSDDPIRNFMSNVPILGQPERTFQIGEVSINVQGACPTPTQALAAFQAMLGQLPPAVGQGLLSLWVIVASAYEQTAARMSDAEEALKELSKRVLGVENAVNDTIMKGDWGE